MSTENYTYQKKRCSKKVSINFFSWIAGQIKGEFTGRYEAFVIIGKDGRKIAEASNEKNAALIVASLNGVA